MMFGGKKTVQDITYSTTGPMKHNLNNFGCLNIGRMSRDQENLICLLCTAVIMVQTGPNKKRGEVEIFTE